MRGTPKKPAKVAKGSAAERDEALAKLYGAGSARTIRDWRKNGAPLDDPAQMDEWLAARQKNPVIGGDFSRLKNLNDAKLEKIRLECQRIAFNNEREAGQYAKKTEVLEKVAAMLTEHCSSLRRIFERELPPVCEGLTAADIQRKNSLALDKLFTLSRQKAEKCTG